MKNSQYLMLEQPLSQNFVFIVQIPIFRGNKIFSLINNYFVAMKNSVQTFQKEAGFLCFVFCLQQCFDGHKYPKKENRSYSI